jgi:hypothetical protein
MAKYGPVKFVTFIIVIIVYSLKTSGYYKYHLF